MNQYLQDAIALAEAMFTAAGTGSGTATISLPDIANIGGKELSVSATITFSMKAATPAPQEAHGGIATPGTT